MSASISSVSGALARYEGICSTFAFQSSGTFYPVVYELLLFIKVHLLLSVRVDRICYFFHVAVPGDIETVETLIQKEI